MTNENIEKYFIELLPAGPMREGIEETLKGRFWLRGVNDEGKTKNTSSRKNEEQARPDPDNYREPE